MDAAADVVHARTFNAPPAAHPQCAMQLTRSCLEALEFQSACQAIPSVEMLLKRWFRAKPKLVDHACRWNSKASSPSQRISSFGGSYALEPLYTRTPVRLCKCISASRKSGISPFRQVSVSELYPRLRSRVPSDIQACEWR